MAPKCQMNNDAEIYSTSDFRIRCTMPFMLVGLPSSFSFRPDPFAYVHLSFFTLPFYSTRTQHTVKCKATDDGTTNNNNDETEVYQFTPPKCHSLSFYGFHSFAWCIYKNKKLRIKNLNSVLHVLLVFSTFPFCGVAKPALFNTIK